MNLRCILLANYTELSRIALCPGEVQVLRKIQSRGIYTSHEMVEDLGISSQSASQRLKNLFDKGYLNRVSEPDPTGGYYYVYSLTDELKEIKIL